MAYLGLHCRFDALQSVQECVQAQRDIAEKTCIRSAHPRGISTVFAATLSTFRSQLPCDYQNRCWHWPLRPFGGRVTLLCSANFLPLGSMPQAVRIGLVGIVHWVLAPLSLIHVMVWVVCCAGPALSQAAAHLSSASCHHTRAQKGHVRSRRHTVLLQSICYMLQHLKSSLRGCLDTACSRDLPRP